MFPAIYLACDIIYPEKSTYNSVACEKWRKSYGASEEKGAPKLGLRSDVPDAGRRSDPRRVVGALSCFPPKIAITKRVRALCVRAARSVWLSRGRIFCARRRHLLTKRRGCRDTRRVPEVAINVYTYITPRTETYLIKRALFVPLLRSGGVRGRSVGRADERTSERRTNERQTNERTAGRERKEQISAREKESDNEKISRAAWLVVSPQPLRRLSRTWNSLGGTLSASDRRDMSVFGGDDRILLEEIVESTEQSEIELCGWVFKFPLRKRLMCIYAR